MIIYENSSGNSSIIGYDESIDSITVYFNDGSIYIYTNSSAGIHNIETMKKLANQGYGLNAFINKYVKNDYAKKIR